MTRLTGFVRRMGSVTTKVQRRRETLLQTKYPEYSGNVPTEPTQPNRGRRLGGSFSDPSRTVPKLDGSENFFDTDERRNLEANFLGALSSESAAPGLSQSLADMKKGLEEYESRKPPISEEKARKVKKLTSIDFASKVGHKRSGPVVQLSNTFPVLREEEEMLFPSNQRLTGLLDEYFGTATSYVKIHNTSVPAVIDSTLTEFEAARTTGVVFNESFRQLLRFDGEDVQLVLDHFVTAPIRLCRIGDTLETCVIDTKGFVMTTALVSRLGESTFTLLLWGNDKEAIHRYLAQYVVYSRQSGMDIKMDSLHATATLSLYGEMSGLSSKLASAVAGFSARLGLDEGSEQVPDIQAVLPHQPPMTTITVNFSNHCDSLLITKLPDHFLLQFVSSQSSILDLLYSLPGVVPGGAYALEMLRTSQGLPRPEVDIPSASATPVKAGLSRLVDNQKIREKTLFGHERIAKDQLRGVSHKRVALVASKYVYGGCKILSAPHRFPIGEITSCAWNPDIERRVCHAYVKPEFAVLGNAVLVTVPQAVPDSVDLKFKKRIVKQGPMQNVFRKLIPGRISQFPIQVDRERGDDWDDVE